MILPQDEFSCRSWNQWGDATFARDMLLAEQNGSHVMVSLSYSSLYYECLALYKFNQKPFEKEWGKKSLLKLFDCEISTGKEVG